MPYYEVLKQKSLRLPERLGRRYAKEFTLGGLFCSCFGSTMGESIKFNAQLIQNIAKCLAYYPFAEETKLAVLIGIHIYVWQNYEQTLQLLLNKPLLETLARDLEVYNWREIDSETYDLAFKELELFCQWVFENNQCIELSDLYRMFPTDLIANIHSQRYQSREEESLVGLVGSTLGSFVEQIGLNEWFS